MSTDDTKKPGSPAGARTNTTPGPLAPLADKVRGPTTGQDPVDEPIVLRRKLASDDDRRQPVAPTKPLSGAMGAKRSARRSVRSTPPGGLPVLGPSPTRKQRGLGPRPWRAPSTGDPQGPVADLLGLGATGAEAATATEADLDPPNADVLDESMDGEGWDPRPQDQPITMGGPVAQPVSGGPGTTQTPPVLSGAPVGATVETRTPDVVERARNVAAAAPGTGATDEFPWFKATDGSKPTRMPTYAELYAAVAFVEAADRGETDATQAGLVSLARKVIKHATRETNWHDATDLLLVTRTPTYAEMLDAQAFIAKERTRPTPSKDTIALAEAVIQRGKNDGIGASPSGPAVVVEAETPDEWRPGMLPPSGYRVEGDRLVLTRPPAEPAAPHNDTESHIEEAHPQRAKMSILTILGFGPIDDDVDEEEREGEMRARRIGIAALVAAVLVLGVAIGLFRHTVNTRLAATDLVMSELQKAGEMANGLDKVFVRNYLESIPMGIQEKNGRLTEQLTELEARNSLLEAELTELEEASWDDLEGDDDWEDPSSHEESELVLEVARPEPTKPPLLLQVQRTEPMLLQVQRPKRPDPPEKPLTLTVQRPR